MVDLNLILIEDHGKDEEKCYINDVNVSHRAREQCKKIDLNIVD